MNRTTLVVLCAATLAVSLIAANQALATGITAGNLVVVQAGDGVASLSSAAAQVAVKEYTTGGTLVQAINMPTTAGSGSTPNPFVLQGSATSEGFITLSTDGNYLTLAGYNTTPGTASPNTQTAASIARVVGRITVATGAVDTTTGLGDAYNGSSIRNAVSTNGTDIWTSGNGGSGQGASAGTRYTTLGSSTSVGLHSTTTNTRVVNIFGGQLYNDASSSPFFGVGTVGTGLPTTSGQTFTELSGFPTSGTHSSYDYWFKDASTLYVADDGGATSGGGIQKWTLSSGTWSLAYTLLNNGTTTTAVRGLAGTVDGSGNAVLYATTTASSANSIITVTDTGAGATSSVVATAGANTVFRGVEFIPVPEPSTLILSYLGFVVLVGMGRRRSA